MNKEMNKEEITKLLHEYDEKFICLKMKKMVLTKSNL